MRRLYFGAMSAKGTPREGMGTPRESPRGSPEAEEAIAGIHKAHELPKAAAAKPLPAKSTVGIVLEGCSVNICVPGSPSSKDVRDPMQEQADCDEPLSVPPTACTRPPGGHVVNSCQKYSRHLASPPCAAHILLLLLPLLLPQRRGISSTHPLLSSPFASQYGGKKIEPGDTITKIDGKPVTASDIIQRLRGSDVPGSKVKLSLTRGKQNLEFVLVRAEMRSVMNIKDLYMSLGELNSLVREDGVKSLLLEDVAPLVDAVENSVENVIDFMTAAQGQSHAINHDLEDLVRRLYVAPKEDSGLKEELKKAESSLKAAEAQSERAKKEVEGLKAQLADARKAATDADAASKKLEGERDRAMADAKAAGMKLSMAEEKAAALAKAAEEKAKIAKAAEAKGAVDRQTGDARRAQVAEEHEKYLKEVVADLQGRLASSDFELQSCKGKLEKAMGDVEKAKQDYVACRKELKEAVEVENILRKRTRGLEEELASRRGPENTYSILRHENDEMRRQIESLREERREARETIAGQFSELRQAQDAIALLQQGRGDWDARKSGGSSAGGRAGAKGSSGGGGGEIYKLQRELCAAQRMIVALEGEVSRMNAEKGGAGGVSRAAAAQFVHSVESLDLDKKGMLWLNSRTDDVWEVLGLAGLCFFAGVAVRDLASPTLGPKATYVIFLICALLFGVFFILTIFKVILALSRGGANKQERRQLVSLPEHAPLLTDHYQSSAAQHHDSALGSISAGRDLGRGVSRELQEAEAEYNSTFDRRSAAVGVLEEAGSRASRAAPSITWTGSSSARGSARASTEKQYLKYAGAGGGRTSGMGGPRAGERVSALKGAGAYGSVDFSMV